MLGEKKIVAFSPELGNSNSASDHFYPNLDLLLNEILPQNLISALYAIQRTGYFLRFFTLKNSYLECSIIQNYQHKFMDQNEEEKKELKICMENNHLYQFSNTIALKNSGFSDFRGKTKIKLLININNVKYLSIKADSGSNSNINKSCAKRNIYDRNITEIIQNANAAIANSGNKTDNSYLDIDSDNKNVVFKHNNSFYLLTEIEQENIDNQNFNLIDIKLYFDKEFIKEYFAEQDIIAKSEQIRAASAKLKNENQSQKENESNKEMKNKHPENDIFKRISLEDFLVTAFLQNEFISISKTKLDGIPILSRLINNNNRNSNTEIENIIKNNRLYFTDDNYKIKLNQFEIFEIKKKQTKEFSLIEGFFDLIIYSTLMFFLILSIVLGFYKIKIWCEKRRIRREMDDLPNSARSENLNGKRYAELQTLENSISTAKDSPQNTGPKYDF